MNEPLYLIASLIDLTLILLLLRFGRSGLVLAITVNLILVAVFAPLLIQVLGFTSNIGNIFYGSLFLAANMLIEIYGGREAIKGIWLSFTGCVLFVTMSQFVVRFDGSDPIKIAINSVFSNSPRIALASILAYILVQLLNVWVYTKLKQARNARPAWFRYLVSIVSSQFLDSLLFFSLAFYMVMPDMMLLEAIIVGFVIKTVIGLLGLPFFYLGIKLKPEVSNNVDQD